MSEPLTLQSLPLFPLGTVLFPDGLLPLRIFEVRYLDMIGKCHKAGAPFGVVSLTQGQEVRRAGARTESFHPVGTIARIDSLTTPQPGLLLIQCTGMQRFRIQRSERLPHGLWLADVESLPDDTAVVVPPDLEGIAQALARLLETLRDRAGADVPLNEPLRLDDCGWVANRWCELLPMPVELKQRFMSLDNPLVRLELVGDVLSRTGIST